MKHYKLWNRLFGWLAFAIAAATYLLTIEPTASFWDCGEFISSAYKLDVGHPPGAPFFMLMGHFASLFASDTAHVAMCVNAMSALASAFTILFLFWTITALGKKLLVGTKGELSLWQGIAIIGAGLVGSLAYTFSDTFWFSAVEGEVYASSSLFTAVVFWLILKWDEHAEEEGSDRWLILIAYLMGLSIGVHLLNLLTIPAIVLVYYFRKYEFSWKGTIIAFLVSVVILAAILYGIIPGMPTIAGWFELLFVNQLGCPFNTGLAVYLVLLAVALVWAVISSYRAIDKEEAPTASVLISFVLAISLAGVPFLKESAIVGVILILAISGILIWKRTVIPVRWLNTAVLMVAMVVIGYSSYATLVIRSSADTPMDQNSPDNVFSLKYYLNREQYGDTPLFYGASYNAPVALEIKGNMCVPIVKEGSAQYAPAPKKSEDEKDRYVVTGHKSTYKMQSEYNMLFPRMFSSDPRHVSGYKEWGEIKGKKVRYEYCGQMKTDKVPTFWENMRYFFRYQVDFMYWRYFMWNFAGRQNDIQGYGEIQHGNWISGIPFIDNARLGDQDALPKELRENKGHNVYYMLPLLLGIIGIVYQLSKKRKGIENFSITFLLFFLTGLAIVIYLNQVPYQPRERDYAYAGSFYAFCIWIGLAVPAIVDGIASLFEKKGKDSQTARTVVAIAATVICLGVPALMAQQNWDDHDRSGRYSCRDFGANYLRSCGYNGIIFSNGDNDTFPLWYNQEVEGERTDLRVCNLSYLQTDWYIGQMKRPYYKSKALPISWDAEDFMPGKNEVAYIDNKVGSPLTIKTAFKFLRSDDPRTKKEGESYIPTNKLYLPIDTADVKASPVFCIGDSCVYPMESIAERIDYSLGRRLTRSEMMILEMMSTNHWKRPMYFAVTVGGDYYQGMEKYFELTGLAYQITPVASEDGQPRVNTKTMYDNMMHKFRYGNMNQEGIYIDENLMRMCRTHRMMFAQLADALYKEGDYAKVKKVLDYAEKMLPEYNIPYDYTSATMAVLYNKIGDSKTGNEMLTKVANNCVDYINWGASLNAKNRKYVASTLQQKTAVLGFVLQEWSRTNQKDLLDRYYPYYEQGVSYIH